MPTLTTQCKTRPVDIDKPTQLTTASSSQRDRDVSAAQTRQSYASVVSTRRDGPHDAGGDVELPCHGESLIIISKYV